MKRRLLWRGFFRTGFGWKGVLVSLLNFFTPWSWYNSWDPKESPSAAFNVKWVARIHVERKRS